MLKRSVVVDCPHRTDDHGADAVYGYYTIIEIDGDGSVDAEFRLIGDVLNQQTHDELQVIGCQNKIPLFVDHQRSKALYDEDTIVNRLDEHFDS